MRDASAMVCAGNSCSAIATSPKRQVEVDEQTSPAASASAAARLVASVVLPKPPLAEKTVIRACRAWSAPAAVAGASAAPCRAVARGPRPR